MLHFSNMRGITGKEGRSEKSTMAARLTPGTEGFIANGALWVIKSLAPERARGAGVTKISRHHHWDTSAHIL